LSNGKIAPLGPHARLLDVAGIIYSARELRDGILTEIDVRTVATLVHVSRWKPAVDELCLVGRWLHSTDGNYVIHDYLRYQPSRLAVLKEREAARVRKRKSNGTYDTPESGGSSPGVQPDSGESSLHPVPGTNVVNPAGSGSSPAARLPGRARVREDTDPQLLAEHLKLIARDRASRGLPSQPDSKSSENGETKDDAQR
jgi:hypothetical protein